MSEACLDKKKIFSEIAYEDLPKSLGIKKKSLYSKTPKSHKILEVFNMAADNGKDVLSLDELTIYYYRAFNTEATKRDVMIRTQYLMKIGKVFSAGRAHYTIKKELEINQEHEADSI